MANRRKPKEKSAVVIASKEENKLVGVNAGDPTPPSSTDTNVLVNANFSILKSQLDATFLYKGQGKGYSLLVAPENPKQTSGSSTLDDIAEAIGGIGGNASSVTNALDSWGITKAKRESIEISLDMAFLYIDKDKDEKPPAKDNEPSKQFEFAFQISVTDKKKVLFPEEISSLFTFDKIKLSIWHTDREKVLNEMHLKTPDQILKEWDSPNK